jgi:hypothetical protein
MRLISRLMRTIYYESILLIFCAKIDNKGK